MLGKTIGDLEAGDVFEPVRYTLTSFICSEYAHAMEDDNECYYSDKSAYGRQIRPPTMIHVDKMRLIEANCDEERRIRGLSARDARIHYEYHAQYHSPAFVGEELVVTGHIAERYVNRGREYLRYEIRVETSDGRLITTYSDRTLLKYKVNEEAMDA